MKMDGTNHEDERVLGGDARVVRRMEMRMDDEDVDALAALVVVDAQDCTLPLLLLLHLFRCQRDVPWVVAQVALAATKVESRLRMKRAWLTMTMRTALLLLLGLTQSMLALLSPCPVILLREAAWCMEVLNGSGLERGGASWDWWSQRGE